MEYGIDEITQAPNITVEQLQTILRDSYGVLEGEYHQLTGYEDCNFCINNVEWVGRSGPESIIVKVTNPIEAKHRSHMDFQVNLCKELSSEGIPVPELVPLVDGKSWTDHKINEQLSLPIRVFYKLPGVNVEEVDFTPSLVRNIGEVLARFHQVADNVKETTVHLPFISPENHICILRESEFLQTREIVSKERAQMVRQSLQDYVNKVVNQNKSVDKGLIHSDFNETNILVDKDNTNYKVSGIVDFGDCHMGPRVLDIAACALYLHLSDRLHQGISAICTSLLEGYKSVKDFDEFSLLLTCMRARLACSLTYGLRTARLNYRGGSVEYILKTQSNGWAVLKELLDLGELTMKNER